MDEHKRERFWAGHIEAFRVSGQPQRAYCARHGLAPRSLRSWRTRLHGPVRPVPKEDDAWMGGAGHGASPLAIPRPEAAPQGGGVANVGAGLPRGHARSLAR